MTAANASAGHSGLSIGAVLARLKPDFPDLSISKIRFLESEELVTPERTASGYRQFSAADIERLRYVLTAQRDHYLPLKIIKEQLDSADRGDVSGSAPLRLPRSLVAATPVPPGDLADGTSGVISRDQLLDDGGLTSGQLAECESAGLIVARPDGSYDAESLVAARSLAELLDVGLEARHLRSIRTTAEREATMITQLLGAQAQRRSPDARHQVAEEAANHAATVLRLHALLLKSALREQWGT